WCSTPCQVNRPYPVRPAHGAMTNDPSGASSSASPAWRRVRRPPPSASTTAVADPARSSSTMREPRPVRSVVQRVREASVTVDGEVVGAIGPGLLALVGVTHHDGEAEAVKLATKLANL